MDKAAQILAYDFKVYMQMQSIGNNPSNPPISEHDIVATLNITTTIDIITKSIAEEIEGQMKGVLPNYRVGAEIFFNEGSIVALGTVLITILSPLAVELGKAALGEGEKALVGELTPVIRVAIQRALRRILPGWIGGNQISKMEVAVRAPSEADGEPPTRPSEIRANSTSGGEQLIRSREGNVSPLGSRQIIPQYFVPLTVVNTLFLFVLLILLAVVIIRLP